jgi:hypothetical protein
MEVTRVHVPKMRAGRIEVFEEGREEKEVDFKGGELGNEFEYLLRKKVGNV